MPVKRYNGTSWDVIAGDGQAGAPGAPGTSSSINTWVKTASGGETSLSGSGDTGYGSLSYTVGQELVYLNGALLTRGSDYVATTGTSLTGLTALTAGDIVTVWTVNSFSVANTYTQAQSDARYPAKAGSVLQVVSAVNTSAITTTTQYPSFASSGFTVTITPSSSTSKILILAAIPFLLQNKTDLGGATRIVRNSGSTVLFPQTAVYNQYADGIGNSFATTHSHVYLDSPATTSAVTYEIQFCQSSGGSSTANISFSGQSASLTVMEIGA